MPNQDPSNQNNQANSPDPGVSFATQTDLPPMPADFQNIQKDSGSVSPAVPNINNIVSSPKKKFGTGKIIATILGILMLVGGLGAGTYLIGQKQLFQQKAGSCTGCATLGALSCVTNNGVNNGTQCECVDITQKGKACTHDYHCEINYDACPTPAPAPEVIHGRSCEDNGFVCSLDCPAGHSQTGNCNAAGSVCCDTASNTTASNATAGCVFDHYVKKQVCVEVSGQWMRCDTEPTGEMGVQTGCNNDAQCQAPFDNYVAGLGYTNCIPGGYCANTSQKCTPAVLEYANCTQDNSCGTTTSETSENPTPTPTSAAPYCAAVTTYSSDWTLISSSERSSLTAGTVIYFCVSGYTPSGSFDSARFTINGVLQADTTTQRSGSTDFCQAYTIPSEITTISVSAQVHHSILGWF